ncbi:hypothetical protein BDW68DRAFT_150384 [Aspergillus falconensis]
MTRLFPVFIIMVDTISPPSHASLPEQLRWLLDATEAAVVGMFATSIALTRAEITQRLRETLQPVPRSGCVGAMERCSPPRTMGLHFPGRAL